LTELDKLDSNRAAREEALNSLEAYIYRSRDLLEDFVFRKVSSDAQRKTFKEKIESASEWLFSSDSATLEDFKAKLAELMYSFHHVRLMTGLLRHRFRRGKRISLLGRNELSYYKPYSTRRRS